ncbi:MAG TPA: holo-ACP synthase [Syntrophobacter fumaroxidans]|nr:holo-ACP synthase [Syntrophobacter fumaroxidans]
MAIRGIGIDLIRVDRLRLLLERWGARFEQRVFTRNEREDCSRRKDYAGCLALRFSAKEAFAKALGTGLRNPVTWQDIEVSNDSLGKPTISLSESALRFCREHNITSWHLSLTDDGDYGAAVVVLEGPSVAPGTSPKGEAEP